jgi:hypothetical protein
MGDALLPCENADWRVSGVDADAEFAREGRELPLRLDAATIEGIAQRVVELLRSKPSGAVLVDAATVANALGVSRDCVYTYASELGGERIGNGPRGRLRFDLDRALATWTSGPMSEELLQSKAPLAGPRPTSRRRRRLSSAPELLPIRGATSRSKGGRRRS